MLRVGQERKAGLGCYAGVCCTNTAPRFQSSNAERAPVPPSGSDGEPGPGPGGGSSRGAGTATGARRASSPPLTAVPVTEPNSHRGPALGRALAPPQRDTPASATGTPEPPPGPNRSDMRWWQQSPWKRPASGLEAMEGQGGGRTPMAGEGEAKTPYKF